jgi:membrane protein implicated in regulation of membrane protease activity
MLEPTFWHWWIVAGLLLAVEVFTATFAFLWLAGAGVLTGLVVLALPGWGWPWQTALFALLAAAGVIAWARRQGTSRPTASHLNRRAEQCLGELAVLDEAIVGGRGRVRIADSTWTARGPELPVGSRVRVVAVDGGTLVVEPLPTGDGP